jgi:hypothetical protein
MILLLDEVAEQGLTFGGIVCSSATIGGHLSQETRQELSEAGFLGRCFSQFKLRIHHCACGRYFIADRARKTCSEKCHQAATAETVKRNQERRTLRRKENRDSAKCVVCKEPLAGSARRKYYCSAKCRKHANRHWGKLRSWM